MQGKEIQALVEDAVHAGTQRRERGFDVTVATIHEVAAPGRLDFGGGEQEPGTAEPVPTSKRNPDDDYGWWTLEPGTYRVTYNEALALDGQRLVLKPREALADQGLAHPTLVLDDRLPAVPLTVSGAGARIKENARLSTLVPL